MIRPTHAADSIGRQYLSLAERAGPRGADPYISAGDYCAKCGGGPMTRVSKARVRGAARKGRDDWRDVCASCMKPWEGRSAWVFRRGVGGSHRLRFVRDDTGNPVGVANALTARPHSGSPITRGTAEDAMIAVVSPLLRVRRIVETPPPDVRDDHWAFSVTAWLAYLHHHIGSVARVVEYGREHRPAWDWTVESAQEGIGLARAWVASRDRDETWEKGERMDRMNDTVTVAEAAQELAISPRRVREWVHAGTLDGINVGQPGAKRPTLRVTKESIARVKEKQGGA